ncbi:hypothetical protein PS652_02711 [Pseudomonas fluorescens]|uniref:Uncharacterized protein n=2 Tax=Pseudomonas TaxID=286 RepID=A0A5E6TTG4_PSEFL|nr:hypothetical protein PS652_03018 [Pseudomonas fluorescens]
MPRMLTLLLCCALFPTSAWSALSLGEFTLGMPRAQVVEVMKRHYTRVWLINGVHYEMPRQYYQAVDPLPGVEPYKLGDVQISRIEAAFDKDGRLRQVSLSLETTDGERAMQLVPLMRQAKEAPNSSGRHDLLLEDGELTYWTSAFWEWTVINIADKPTSLENIPARARSDENQRAKAAKR